MPLLRFTRDKRGYEHFQLVQPGVNRRDATRPRILYWFRSPPNVRVGREPFDADARAALEKHNPDVDFDWAGILATPVPSADAERWRERRRQERAARQFNAEEADESEPADALDHVERNPEPVETPGAIENLDIPPQRAAPTIEGAANPGAGVPRRNRRRRGRRRHGHRVQDAKTTEQLTAEPSTPVIDPDFERK